MKPHQRFHSTISFIILSVILYLMSLICLLTADDHINMMAEVFLATLGITFTLIPILYWCERKAKHY